MRIVTLTLVAALLAGPAAGQGVPQPARGDRDAVQHGAQPNPQEVRPGSPDGDAPSAAAGELVPKPARRILGLPVTTVLVMAGVLLALAILAGIVIPGASRRQGARGGGTYDSR
jgi:hypothetical protein